MKDSWPPATIRLRAQDLKNTMLALNEFHPLSDINVEQCLSRYLTIRSAGYIEAVRDDSADHFVATRASDEAVRRIRHHLRTGQGAAPGQLLQFVGSFCNEWADELGVLLDNDDGLLRRSLASLIAARKKIAHGDGESVTAKRALEWYATANTLGGWIVRRFDPSQPVHQPLK